MRYIVWALRIILFLLVLLFALKNTDPVTVRFFGDYTFAGVPLIVVLLLAFFVGALFAWLVSIPTRLRKTREVGRLKGEVERLNRDVVDTRQSLAALKAEELRLRSNVSAAGTALQTPVRETAVGL